MPSIFPGMDAFLEILFRWQSFHGWFVRVLAEQALPLARERDCWIDVERTIYRRSPSGQFVMLGEPDDTIGVDESLSANNGSRPGPGGVALAQPRVVHDIVLDPDTVETHKQDYLVVRELGRFARVLAVLEVLSPANKEGNYAEKYRAKRQRFLESRAHFLEIDFLRDGDNPSRALFPELAPTPYFVFVARKTALGRKEEGYPLRLQDPLPVIGLPIGPPRPDLPLDLGAAFRAAFDLGIRPGSIAYREESVPPPALNAEDAAWVREVVDKGGSSR